MVRIQISVAESNGIVEEPTLLQATCNDIDNAAVGQTNGNGLGSSIKHVNMRGT